MLLVVSLLLTVLTGFTGLVYEVTWQKYFATLLGSHSEASAAVLGLFLAGLSLGYAYFGSVTRRRVERARAGGKAARLLLVYAAVEAAIGVYAICFPQLFEWVRGLSYALPHSAGGIGFLFDILLVALLLIPPTLLMGGTIPLLTQALSRDLDDATRVHALVYGVNTAGAFAGALAAAFVLIPWLGLEGSMLRLGWLNLLAGAAFALLGLREEGATPDSMEPQAARLPRELRIFSLVALLSGFALMVLQTVVLRLAGLALGSSEFTFATVVAVFVASIALGSLCVSVFRNIPSRYLAINQLVLVALLTLLYPFIQQIGYWAHLLRIRFGHTPEDFVGYYLASFACLFLVLGPAALLSGATLPLLFHHLRREVGELGGVAGRLYSWNTAGSLIGALLGGYALLFFLDLHHVYRLAVAALALGAAAVVAQLLPERRSSVVAGLLAFVIALALLAPWKPEYLALGLFRNRSETPDSRRGIAALAAGRFDGVARRIVFYDDDPTVSVAVVEAAERGGAISRSVLSNGKSDGSAGGAPGQFGGDYPTMALAGLIPALLAEKAERAFVIGYGTGVTVGELAQLESISQVEVAEISHGVMAAAPLFEFANQRALENAKVQINRSDAHRALMHSEGGFDLIVSEPSNPWVTGVEMLYSKEFLTAARARLAPGGIYVQWYHQYETDAAAVALVLRTYAAVFDRIAVWYASGPDLLVLGFNDANELSSEARLERLKARAARPDFAAGLRRAHLSGLPALLAHELIPVGMLAGAKWIGPIHTLYRPLLNHVAGAAFYRGATGRLPPLRSGESAAVGERASLFRRYLTTLPEALAPAVHAKAAREACIYRRDQCAAFLAEWQARDPRSPGLAKLREWVQLPGIRFGGVVEPEIVERLAGFFADSRAQESVPVGFARKATQLYRGFYQVAVPFDARTLVSLWQRCAAHAGAGGACAQGLSEARSLLPPALRAAGGNESKL